MTRLSSALTTKKCDGTLKDPVICDLLRIKGLRTPGLYNLGLTENWRMWYNVGIIDETEKAFVFHDMWWN